MVKTVKRFNVKKKMADLYDFRQKKIREFYRFLVETKSVVKFFHNFGKKSMISGLGYVAFMKYTTPSNFIMNSFTWHKTPEGSSYWSDLHSKWIRKYF